MMLRTREKGTTRPDLIFVIDKIDLDDSEKNLKTRESNGV